MAQKDQAANYDASSIKVLKGLEAIQKRPDMYTRTETPTHIIQEAIDNACDEAQNGHANLVDVIIHDDDSITVGDNGRGIPVDMHEEGVPAVQVIFTTPHSGGKFDGDSYKISGGLHGIGVTVTNALSKRLEVAISRKGKSYHIGFEHGAVSAPLSVTGKVEPDVTGTRIRAWPDEKYFDAPRVKKADIKHLLRARSAMLPGVKMTYRDDESGEALEWCYDAGLAGYLAESLPEDGYVSPCFSGERFLSASDLQDAACAEGEGASWALAWCEVGGAGESFVNLIPTPQGGTHEAGLRAGLFESLRDFIAHHALMPRGISLQAEDVWKNCRFILSAKVKEPRFQGQTKDRLNSRESLRMVATRIKDPLDVWLNANLDDAKKIADLAIRQATSRQKSGKAIEKKKSSGMSVLPGKLTDCQSSDTDRNELFLVEGDSAGGSAKQGRDREYQAILPLRGKILNTWEIDRSEIYGNNEVHDIAVALGIDPHDRDADNAVLENLRYGKVVILSDADVDGSHIQTLLLALFLRHFPKLVTEGHVYVAQPPLYCIKIAAAGKSKPERRLYALDEGERDKMLERLAQEGVREDKIHVGRFKGLGEMNPDQLKETTMNPDIRRMVQMRLPENYLGTDLMFNLLMSKSEAAGRKAWMEEKGNLVEADI